MRSLRRLFVPALLVGGILMAGGMLHAQTEYSCRPAFSTYLGGSRVENLRDITTDSQGNVYVTGGTASPDFPTTEGAYDRTFATGGSSLGSGGPMDIFVTKYSPTGVMLWSTYVGGPNYDRAYAIEVDDEGYVYIGGRAGDDFPTTAGVVQESFAGDTSPNGLYGKQDGFIAKLSPDGSQLLWATYFGAPDMGFFRDIDIDSEGNVYGIFTRAGAGNPHITPGAHQPEVGGKSDVVVLKLAPDASRVIWATYFGGSGDDGGGPSIRVGPEGSVFVVGSTDSRDLPITSGAYDSTYAGGQTDFFVLRYSSEGVLTYATYLGGSGNDGLETHNLAVDSEGHAYVVGFTTSDDIPVTPGVVGRNHPGGAPGNVSLYKLSPDGSALLACTYIGGTGGDNAQGIAIDGAGNVVIGGSTLSPDFPVTPHAYQTEWTGTEDIFGMKLTGDLTRILCSTLLAGSAFDDGRTAWVDPDGTMYVAGHSESNDFPTVRAHQTTRAGDDDGVITKLLLEPVPDSSIVEFAADCVWIREDLFAQPVDLIRTGSVDESLDVSILVEKGDDLQVNDLPATFGVGEFESFWVARPVNDTLTEGIETVRLSLQLAPGSKGKLGADSTITLYIVDDETDIPNLLIDPGFENDGNGWQKTTFGGRSIDAGTSRTGSRSVRMEASDQYNREVFQTVPITPGKDYGVSTWVRAQSGSRPAELWLVWVDIDSLRVERELISSSTYSDWKSIGGCATAPEWASMVHVRLHLDVDPLADGAVWFDDVELLDLSAGASGVGHSSERGRHQSAVVVRSDKGSVRIELRDPSSRRNPVTCVIYDMSGSAVARFSGLPAQIHPNDLPGGAYIYSVSGTGMSTSSGTLLLQW